MKLAIDVRCLGSERITGVGVYAQYLLLALKDQKNETDYWLPWRKRAQAAQINERIAVRPHIFSEVSRIFQPPDVFFGPDFKCPRFGSFKKVIMIHDVVEFESEFMQSDFMAKARKNMTKTLYRNAPDHILAPSDFTKERIQAFYPDLKIPITRVHHGVDHFSVIDKLKTRSPHLKPYILCVGTVETRKNQISALKAFFNFKEKYPQSELQLIIIGGAGPGSELVAAALRENIYSAQVHWLKSLPHPEIIKYYAHAVALLFPSLYEGFGFPILESMRSGTPVITSPFGAMQEVAADCALYADPRKPAEISAALDRLLNDNELHRSLAIAGQKRAQRFTWKNCATETLQVFQSVL